MLMQPHAPPQPPLDAVLTAEEYWQLPEELLRRYELVNGRLEEQPVSHVTHSRCALSLGAALLNHVEERGLGIVAGDADFQLTRNPDTVRVPDACFVREERLPRTGPLPDYFFKSPDIAVEVKSKGQTERKLMQKVEQYLECGARLVWVVRIQKRTLTVYRAGEPVEVLTEHDDLDGGEVLPGFRYPLRRLFSRV